MKWLMRFIPGGAWLNPWIWAWVLGALLAAFLYGVHVESIRFAEFRATVAAVGKAQNDRAAERTAQYKKLKKESDDDYQKRLARLTARLAAAPRWVPVSPDRGFVPPAPSGADSPDRACFDRAELDGALRRSFTSLSAGVGKFVERTRELAAEGDTLKLKLDTAIQWNTDIRR